LSLKLFEEKKNRRGGEFFLTMVRHLLTLKDFKPDEIEKIINKAMEIKQNPENYRRSMEYKTLAMLFQKTSTRTRISFEVGMTQMGGHAIYLDWRTTQFTIAELEDEAKVVSRYVDIIMARLLKHEGLLSMAKVSEVPVINGLCERYHPCQILGDLMTIKEKFGKLKGLKLTYVGIANNVSNSLTVGCTKTGMNFTLCAPERHPISLDQELINEAKKTGLYEENTNIKEAIKDADVIYTDTWVDMEFFTDPKFEKEKERRLKVFMPYQINKELLEENNPKALIMHDMPIHVGYEMTRDVVESKKAIIFDQAENRLHAQKAIILFLLGKI
jgi:ornithine carbamoyltransferase